MYAYLFAKEKKEGIDKINVVAIGSTNELSEKIEADASERVRLDPKIANPECSRETSHPKLFYYMLNKIMKHNEGSYLFEFNIERSACQAGKSPKRI